MKQADREKLLQLEQRILEADERLTAARNALEEAKRTGADTPEMATAIGLMTESLSAMITYRDLLLRALRSSAKAEAD